MPLRNLLYFARSYEKLMDTKLRYRRSQVRIPAPEFYVFYNGTENYPVESELKLSDSYIQQDADGKVWAELTVKVININLDKHHPILEKCPILKEYMLFVDRVRAYKANGEDDAVTKAVTECMKEGIFADYLRERGSEVMNMLIAEYDYETDMAVHEMEAEERGILIGEERGRELGILIGEERGKELGILIGEERGRELGILIGEERGRELGKYSAEIALIRKKLLRKKTFVQIADEIEEDVDFVSELAGLIQANPDKTDLEIYQLYDGLSLRES